MSDRMYKVCHVALYAFLVVAVTAECVLLYGLYSVVKCGISRPCVSPVEIGRKGKPGPAVMWDGAKVVPAPKFYVLGKRETHF